MVKKTARRSKKPPKASKPKKVGLYSNFAYKRRVKADTRSRKKAEELAKLPKNPVLRFFAKLHPKRVLKFWFSRDGLLMLLKIIAAAVLIAIIVVGGLFLYFKKEADACGSISDRVTDTVNTYLDRNGVVLWEDKGDGDYRLTVDGDEISSYMRQATVAREDRNFYNHIGVDFNGLARAMWMTLTRQSVQGGSTLTQQLIKQVCFAAEAQNRDFSGIPRKIKEVILALEVEKMYDKEQIITLYLNESPFGGRRNGVESGAQTYFGKSSRDLTLAEAALLAALPNNPAWLNPYNYDGNEELIYWQHYILDAMVDMKFITREQAKEAKDVPILDQILPEESQYKNIKAPWFVLEVKKQLEEKYGVGTIRAGGFTVTTTLDFRAQEYAEAAIDKGEALFRGNNSDNATLAAVDVETAQVIAMAGSISWDTPIYGQVNAATSLLEPASSIKPVLDYAPLFMQREGQNWGPGSILRDENINDIYCAGYIGRCSINNATGWTAGDITIRRSLGNSLNRPAVKALYINGIENSLDVVRRLGNHSYCAYGENAGLSMAIGGGCSVRPVEHANTYASLGRGGVYKPLVYWLELRNSSGDIIDRWEDIAGDRVLDEQTAYMVTDILADPAARSPIFGAQAHSFGFKVPGVWSASKTGTTDDGRGNAKDSWFMTYSPVIAVAVWNGNHDGRPIGGSNTVVRRIANDFMEPVHKNIYGPEGKWTENQKIPQPAGIQTLTVNGHKDIWPSWYNEKTSGIQKISITIDTVTLKLASTCTPASTQRVITIYKSIDPIRKKEVFRVGDADFDNDQRDTIIHNWQNEIVDDLHSCSQLALPTVTITGLTPNTSGTYTLDADFTRGSPSINPHNTIVFYEVIVDGNVVASGPPPNSLSITHVINNPTFNQVVVRVRDAAGYVNESSASRPSTPTP